MGQERKRHITRGVNAKGKQYTLLVECKTDKVSTDRNGNKRC